MDYIGLSGYSRLTNKNDPTVEELKSAWVERGYLSRLEGLSQKFQKPIIISEIGYVSADGTNTDPPNFRKFANAAADLQEQADCYQAAFEVLRDKPWLEYSGGSGLPLKRYGQNHLKVSPLKKY